MEVPPAQEGPPPEDQERRSVLADLPRTRPQRASARRERARASNGRAAANQKTSEQVKPSPPQTTQAKPPLRKPPSTTRSRKRAANARPPAPRQGYECDQELAGSPVSPPSGTEVVGALAELAGELAQTGISTGGRLLKSALSRLSGS